LRRCHALTREFPIQYFYDPWYACSHWHCELRLLCLQKTFRSRFFRDLVAYFARFRSVGQSLSGDRFLINSFNFSASCMHISVNCHGKQNKDKTLTINGVFECLELYRVSQKKLIHLIFKWITKVSVFFDSPCTCIDLSWYVLLCGIRLILHAVIIYRRFLALNWFPRKQYVSR
jgi:hypothetical protein